MSGASIASEVSAALAEVGVELGNGAEYTVQLIPALTGGNPWDAPSAPPDPINLRAYVDDFRSDLFNGAPVQAGDKKVMLDATGTAPKPMDTLVIDGVNHRIENVMQLGGAGVPVLFMAQARKSG